MAACNVGGELLNWIARLGAVRSDLPSFLDAQPGFGQTRGV